MHHRHTRPLRSAVSAGRHVGAALLLHCSSLAAGAEQLEEVEVTGRRADLVGGAVSASQGVVGQAELQLRPLLRPGDVLETVPGMIVTQHSGSGKANQYFLRGFNLDHGTDFATFYDHMPLNLRSHGHGQGYTDLGFVIPELLESVTYAKGPYDARIGDFSGAGSASMTPVSRLDSSVLQATAGKDGYGRLLGAGSWQVGNGELLLGAEGQVYDGPWTDVSEDVEKLNGIARYSREVAKGTLALTGLAYHNTWNSADQIPERAVSEGLIDRLGSIDPTSGGETSRYSLSGSWSHPSWQASAYAIRYRLNLWSNFTYYLDDPVAGDQFKQVDQRWIYGGELVRLDTLRLGRAAYDNAVGRELVRLDTLRLGRAAYDNAVGLQLRYDDIAKVGLYHTQARQRLDTVRQDAIAEGSAALYWSGTLRWADQWRANLGLRYDEYRFDVDSDVAANSGRETAGIGSYKFNLSYQPNARWETHLGVGTGFHSNDARGVTATEDPASGAPVTSVDPLVRSQGAELGARFFSDGLLSASVALWGLDLDSELVFVGDAGNTEPSRSSRRYGVEVTAYWWLNPRWSLDAEYAYTRARFAGDDLDSPDSGNAIPGAVPEVFSAGITRAGRQGWFGSARLRYFSPRPLVESGAIESGGSTAVNLRGGYRWHRWELFGDLLNALDSRDHDIDYFYTSRLPDEAAGGIEDIHFHPLEPRTYRLNLAYRPGR